METEHELIGVVEVGEPTWPLAPELRRSAEIEGRWLVGSDPDPEAAGDHRFPERASTPPGEVTAYQQYLLVHRDTQPRLLQFSVLPEPERNSLLALFPLIETGASPSTDVIQPAFVTPPTPDRERQERNVVDQLVRQGSAVVDQGNGRTAYLAVDEEDRRFVHHFTFARPTLPGPEVAPVHRERGERTVSLFEGTMLLLPLGADWQLFFRDPDPLTPQDLEEIEERYRAGEDPTLLIEEYRLTSLTEQVRTLNEPEEILRHESLVHDLVASGHGTLRWDNQGTPSQTDYQRTGQLAVSFTGQGLAPEVLPLLPEASLADDADDDPVSAAPSTLTLPAQPAPKETPPTNFYEHWDILGLLGLSFPALAVDPPVPALEVRERGEETLPVQHTSHDHELCIDGRNTLDPKPEKKLSDLAIDPPRLKPWSHRQRAPHQSGVLSPALSSPQAGPLDLVIEPPIPAVFRSPDRVVSGAHRITEPMPAIPPLPPDGSLPRAHPVPRATDEAAHPLRDDPGPPSQRAEMIAPSVPETIQPIPLDVPLIPSPLEPPLSPRPDHLTRLAPEDRLPELLPDTVPSQPLKRTFPSRPLLSLVMRPQRPQTMGAHTLERTTPSQVQTVHDRAQRRQAITEGRRTTRLQGSVKPRASTRPSVHAGEQEHASTTQQQVAATRLTTAIGESARVTVEPQQQASAKRRLAPSHASTDPGAMGVRSAERHARDHRVDSRSSTPSAVRKDRLSLTHTERRLSSSPTQTRRAVNLSRRVRLLTRTSHQSRELTVTTRGATEELESVIERLAGPRTPPITVRATESHLSLRGAEAYRISRLVRKLTLGTPGPLRLSLEPSQLVIAPGSAHPRILALTASYLAGLNLRTIPGSLAVALQFIAPLGTRGSGHV